MRLETEIKYLKGVGEAVAKRLDKLGIQTFQDLLLHFPRRYEDYSRLTPLTELKPGPVTVMGKILRVATRRSRRGTSVTEALVDDGKGAVKAVWFNQSYLAKTLPKNQAVYLAGNLEFKYNQYALQNPTVERVSDFTTSTARIVPVYPETAGLTSRQLRGFIEQVLALADKLEEELPEWLIKKAKLLPKAEAVRQLHFPDNDIILNQAKRRMAFEEVFLLVLTGLIIKREIQTEQAPRIKFSEAIAKEFVANLPFELTVGQRKAAWQILQDLDQDRPMNRLLEGDVGSGKTVVAALAALMAHASSYQVALMAPTEVLARQHQANLEQLLAPFKMSVGLLASGLKSKDKQAVLSALAAGDIKLIVGTHALLQPEVDFKNLGLVIIDEQHRFGVQQRQVLKVKAGKLPHLLSMTATPIPRSLALTVYGDLDVSVITELPAERKAIITSIAVENARQQVYRHIDEHISLGRQVYVICPLVTDSDKLGVKSVESEAKRLQAEVFTKRRIGLLHGKLKSAEKEAIMQQFKDGKLDILVSTTVVEVGVDVPNATIMLIEGAERFGLAQLHQLRGRVGRSEHQSYCYLITTNSRQALKRLGLLEQYNSGFILAEKDLELRGAGEIYGRRQHGVLDLQFADISDTKLVAEAQEHAAEFIKNPDNLLQYPQVIKAVNARKAITNLD